jgi:hypothetical protein
MGRKDPTARSAYNREWRARNLERKKAYDQAYYARNREKANARNQAYYLRNKERVAAQHRAYAASHQREVIEFNREYRNKIRDNPALADKMREYQRLYHQLHREEIRPVKRAWRIDHKEEINERNRHLRAENPEPFNRRNQAWIARNPEKYASLKRAAGSLRRARQKTNGPYEHIDALDVWTRDGGRCGICGRLVDPIEFEVDHIIPISRGGSHRMSNVQVAHRSCNRRKAAKIPSAPRSS